MALQASQVNTTYPFILGGAKAQVKESQTILQDASRVAGNVLAQYTVMGQVASSKKWVPFTSVTATTGVAFRLGVCMTDDGVSAASIIAGDVTGVPILYGGPVEVDASQLVFDAFYNGGESALTLDTVFTGNAVGSGTATPYIICRAEDLLNLWGIIPKTVFVASKAEN